MKLNRIEVIGGLLSVGVMALALFLLRQETSPLATVNPADNQAAVVVAGAPAELDGARAQALFDAADARGQLSRLVIEDIKPGTGRAVASGDTVSVHYIGRTQAGVEFDNSYARGTPFTFTVGEGKVIAGWEQGLVGMAVGGERILVIPPSLAYGNRAVGPIPANSPLVFVVELLEIE
jgi:FKBP-type peptidyl-prolyl cis-trans isomerase